MTFDRKAARARCEAATEGPWWESSDNKEDEYGFTMCGEGQLACWDYDGVPVANSRFAAYARTDLPAALDALDAKDKDIATLREALEPFAEIDECDDGFPVSENDYDHCPKCYQCRRILAARAALKETQP